jgi:hypothetical protein
MKILSAPLLAAHTILAGAMPQSGGTPRIILPPVSRPLMNWECFNLQARLSEQRLRGQTREAEETSRQLLQGGCQSCPMHEPEVSSC